MFSYSFVKSTDADKHRLMAVLNKMAYKFNYDALVGVLPNPWLGPFGIEHAYYKKTVLIGNDVDPFVLAHEFGHMLGNFEDYSSEFYVYNNIDASEGFDVPLRLDRRPSVWSLSGSPAMEDSPIRHFMHADPVESVGYKLWAVKWQYDQLLSLFQASLVENLQSGEPLLLASGSIRISDNVVTVDPWYVLEPGEWTAPSAGEYALEFYNGSGLLSSQPFEVGPAVEGISRFILKVPYPAGTSQLRIKHGTAVLFSMTPSPTSPQLNITAPLAGHSWSGKQPIIWTAADADPGSTLYSSLALSTDGGANWDPLTIDATTGASNSFRLDTRGFPSSTKCQVKISVSDGINTTTRTSGTFTITNAPRLVMFNPVSGAGQVNPKSPLVIGFSEPVNPSTINSNTFFLKDPQGTKVEGFLSYRGADQEAAFIPKAALAYNTVYTATVTTGITSVSGVPLNSGSVWAFTTEVNIYPPRVVRFSPGAGDDRVSLNAALITVQFDKPMNPASLTSQSFTVSDKNGDAVSGQISYNASTRTALFRPNANFSADTQYTVTLTSTILDAQGNALDGPFSWGFKTGSENTPWVRLTRHFKDYLWDSNGDGAWDTLVVEAEISVLFTSTYNLSGWLLDKNGLAVARATTGNVALSGGTYLLSLYFSRQDIQNHGGEGPYYFADAVLYDALYGGTGDSLTDPYQIGFTNYSVDADLMLFAYPNPGKTGTPLAFQASVGNQGISNATSVVLTATLPSSVDFVSAASGQGSCTQAGGVVTCTIGTLGSLQSNLVSIVVTPREKGWINFSASVTSVQDSYVANNNQQLSLEVTTGGSLLYLPLILNQ